MKRYILAIDEGTTSERVVLYDTKVEKIIDFDQSKLTQYYPKNGWVEHDAEEIFNKVNASLNNLLTKHKLSPDDIFGIGITNQRETTVAWNKKTGKPISKAICWQCRRTADICNSVRKTTIQKLKEKTGLILDAYFSATKMRWILENVSKAKELEKQDLLCFGTIDSFLIYRLTKGKVFATDTTNASRTMLVDISKPFEYDPELLRYFGIKKETLPTIKNSADNFGYAETTIGQIPICSCIGDQQSSLFGQGCTEVGNAKCTYGTGAFILLNTGNKLHKENEKLLNTVAYSISNQTSYAVEGSVFNVGSALNYVKNTLGLIEEYKLINEMCKSVKDTDGVIFVPAFTGLGAPYWKSNARAQISGISFSTNKNHIVRACIESFAYSIYAIAKYLKELRIKPTELMTDGGVSNNDFLLQYQSSLLEIPVKKSTESESTSMGTIYLTGLISGAYKSISEIKSKISYSKIMKPKKLTDGEKSSLKLWLKEVEKI